MGYNEDSETYDCSEEKGEEQWEEQQRREAEEDNSLGLPNNWSNDL